MNRWLIWTIFVVGWTVALEVPIPSEEGTGGTEGSLRLRRIVGKTTHVLAYATLAVISGWLPLSLRHRVLMMFLLMAHAPATEWLQETLEPYCHRGGSLRDVALDHLGIAIGTLASWKWWTRPDPRETSTS